MIMSVVDEPGIFETRCMSDFVVAGFQAGEKETSFVRMLCTFTTASIISSWIARRDIGRRLRLFFAHWLRCRQDGGSTTVSGELGCSGA
ncbi:unnamed protein product, partial [Scytosiphon promiscuus]